jgi:hypothetical protein
MNMEKQKLNESRDHFNNILVKNDLTNIEIDKKI